MSVTELSDSVVRRDQRLRIEKTNRARLERDLLDKRTVFASRPYEAHIQFSNVCNMSCIMCYDGWLPPVKKMKPEILDRVADQIAPHLSIMIPYGGSEPLIVTWDAARRLAERYSIQMRLTTNVQFLDEGKFYELKDISETLFLSVDSHIPEVFEKIRPGSKPDKVFENLSAAARLSEEHRLECLAQIVFMTENAPMLPETIAHLADLGIRSVNVLQLIDVNGRSGYLDPLIHFSADYVEWIKGKCIEVTREKGTRLIWNAGGYERHDFRKEKVPPDLRKDWNYRWEQRMKRHLPGYCVNVYNRLQIDADGTITPCAYATDDNLILGHLAEQDLDEIWNSANARDLRRGMLTWDYPSLCESCMFTNRPGPEIYLPFVDEVLRRVDRRRQCVDCVLSVEEPAHMTRAADPPSFRITQPAEGVDSYLVAFALGGEAEHVEICALEPTGDQAGAIDFTISSSVWRSLRSNLGYWWAIFGLGAEEPGRTLRSSEIRCLIRHEEMARIEESTHKYPDQGYRAPVDLGGGKQAGWGGGKAQARPTLGARTTDAWRSDRRNGTSADAPSAANTTQRLPAAEYKALIRRIRRRVARALPAEATVLVVSKGDEKLLKLDCRAAWHFPCGERGGYAGYHPRDGGWAVEHLEAMRACGADYLILPATSSWWLESYPEFAHHLVHHYPVVLDDESCVVFGIGPFPAFYGRERDAAVNGHLDTRSE